MVAVPSPAVGGRGLAFVGTVGGLAVAGGVPGAVVGVGAFLAVLIAPVFGFALAQFGLVLVLAPGTPPSSVGVAQVGLFAALFGATAHDDTSAIDAGLYAALAIAAGGLVWGGLQTGLWQGAAALCGAVALVAYGLHRYELVALSLVEASG